jgi:hypothetical protein
MQKSDRRSESGHSHCHTLQVDKGPVTAPQQAAAPGPFRSCSGHSATDHAKSIRKSARQTTASQANKYACRTSDANSAEAQERTRGARLAAAKKLSNHDVSIPALDAKNGHRSSKPRCEVPVWQYAIDGRFAKKIAFIGNGERSVFALFVSVLPPRNSASSAPLR